MCRNLVAVILTKNEAHHITDCIASLRDWVDAVVVWDSASTDATTSLALSAGALVVQRPFDHYAAQRQAALDAINAQWILFVDADERATPELAAEIQALVRGDVGHAADKINKRIDGYWTPRRNFIVGREIRGGGYWPDYQLRLLRRGSARYVAEREVHEIVALDGESARLTAPLIHYNYADWSQFRRKQKFYARYEARILASRGIRPRPHNFVLQPLREVRRRFLTLHGYRDGWAGLRLALLFAWYYGFVPYWLLWRGASPPLTRGLPRIEISG